MILSVVVVNVVISSVVVVVVVVLVAVQYDAQIIKRYENFISPLSTSILRSFDIRLILKSRGANYENTTNVEDKEKHDYFTREVYYRNRGL